MSPHAPKRIFCLICLLAGLPALAAERPEASLAQTLEALESSQEQREALESMQAENAEKLAELKARSLQLAEDVRTLESRIAEQNTALNELEATIAAKQTRLNARREEIATLLYGMVRMQQLPRQFVLAAPGNADSLLRTASALSVSFDATEQAADSLQEELRAFAELKKQAAASRRKLAGQKEDLGEKMETLKASMQKRQAMQARVDADLRKLKRQIAMLSEKSSTLQELLQQLDREQALFQALGAPKAKPQMPAAAGRPDTGRAFAERKGALPYPAAGTRLHRYGARKGPGETYSGEVLRTAPGAMVTAPHRGQVVFADHFMEYGNMLIIRHGDGYHTVLAGLEVMHAAPGQKIRAGEPIGVMGKTPDARELYLELRKNSKAIDPTAWMGNLTSDIARR